MAQNVALCGFRDQTGAEIQWAETPRCSWTEDSLPTEGSYF